MAVEQMKRRHAVIIGGGVAGMLTAKMLTAHFEQVTLIEKDLAAAGGEGFRKGVPQDRQPHLMNPRGEQIVARYFPRFYEDLDKSVLRLNTEDYAFFQQGSWKLQCKSNFSSHFMSRPYMEQRMRERLLAMPNVQLLMEHEAVGLVVEPGSQRVAAVSIADKSGASRTLEADLFVDAGGRGSRIPKWLEANGYGAVPEEKVEVNVCYLSQIFHMSPHDSFKGISIFPQAPEDTRMGVIFPMEGRRWHVSMVGLVGDHPHPSSEGLLHFAQSLARPDIYEAIRRLTPASPVSVFKFPANFRRHYQKMSKLPHNLLSIGDAVSSFNPIYAQGMCVAALEVELLDQMLAQDTDPLYFSRRYFKRQAGIVNPAWATAICEDLRYPAVKGRRTPGIKFLHWYLKQIFELSAVDPAICSAFYNIQSNLVPPSRLFGPAILFKALKHGCGFKGAYRPVLERPAPSVQAGN